MLEKIIINLLSREKINYFKNIYKYLIFLKKISNILFYAKIKILFQLLKYSIYFYFLHYLTK